jgi:hypothetical protein
MVALMKVYQEEDEAYQELVTKATAFYQCLLQPFRDVREVATLCKLDVLKSLDEDELGPKRVAALQKEAGEWSRQAEEAVVSIQDLTVNYFKETVKALAGMQKQMEQDGKRFGQAAWATATPRLERLKLMLARETLQLMRAKELCLNHKRAEIQRKVEDLPEQEKETDTVDEIEMQYYENQLELYEVKFEILRNEEILLTTQLDSIKRLIKEKQDEVVYYDPCESPEELKVIEEAVKLQDGGSTEVRELSQQRRHLEAKRGRICTRRAQLRSRQDQCKENHRLRLQQAQESIRNFQEHHRAQMKRDKIKEEEQKKKEWISQERQKTLQRLRAYKGRSPAKSVPRSPHSGPVDPSRPGGPSQQTSPRQTRTAPFPTVGNENAPDHQDCQGNVPDHVALLVGDQAHSKSSEEVFLPPPPPPPPPPPLLPPPPPPPLPALSSSQPATPENTGPNTSVTEDQPCSLVCESSAERPRGYLESSRCPGSMDEVLASLRQGRSPLRKAEAPSVPPPRSSVNEQILAAIRQGVRLKKVHPDAGAGVGPSSKPASDLERRIKAALQRIKTVSADSEDSDEQSAGEWDH